MKYLAGIKFKNDIEFDSNRDDHKTKFKIKSVKHKVDDHSKPIESKQRFARTKYKKKTITEKSFVIFEKDFEIEFEDLTIIVGDNGTGKSSLIKQLKMPKNAPFTLRSETENAPTKYDRWLENQDRVLTACYKPDYVIVENNIHKNSFIDSVDKQPASANDLLNKFFMLESSNGEVTLDFIEVLRSVKNSLIVLDEPETSLSIRSQLRVRKILKQLSKQNQLIIITHSPILMELSNKVYNFDCKAWTKTNKYIQSQYEK